MKSTARPPRAFERSSSDINDLVLVPLNMDAAYAQEFVRKRAEKEVFEDYFLSYLPLDVQRAEGSAAGGGERGGDAIIFSEMFVYWRQMKPATANDGRGGRDGRDGSSSKSGKDKEGTNLWGRNWSNISHCFFMFDSVGVVLYGGDAQAVVIPCGSYPCAMRIYSAFCDNKHRMGMPDNMIPSDLLAQEKTISDSAKEGLMERKMKAASLAGAISRQRF